MLSKFDKLTSQPKIWTQPFVFTADRTRLRSPVTTTDGFDGANYTPPCRSRSQHQRQANSLWKTLCGFATAAYALYDHRRLHKNLPGPPVAAAVARPRI